MKNLLRLEELLLFGLALFLFSRLEYGWGWFALLFFAPDLSMLGYLANPRVGAWTYNLIHHKGFAVALYVFGYLLALPVLMFVVTLPVSPQGLGTRDALSLALLSGYAHGTAPERTAAVAATRRDFRGRGVFAPEHRSRLKKPTWAAIAVMPANTSTAAIGPLSSELLDREIGDWHRFANRRQVASYTGLCPGEDSSGDSQMSLSVDKHGNPRVRAVLVGLPEAAVKESTHRVEWAMTVAADLIRTVAVEPLRRGASDLAMAAQAVSSWART